MFRRRERAPSLSEDKKPELPSLMPWITASTASAAPPPITPRASEQSTPTMGAESLAATLNSLVQAQQGNTPTISRASPLLFRHTRRDQSEKPLWTIFQSLLRAMALTPTQGAEVSAVLEKYYPRLSSEPHSGLTEPNTVTRLRFIHTLIDDLLGGRVRSRACIKIQAHVRGFLLRRRLASLRSSGMISRHKLLRDFVKNEKKFSWKMETVLRVFYNPLKAEIKRGTLSATDFQSVFSNLHTHTHRQTPTHRHTHTQTHTHTHENTHTYIGTLSVTDFQSVFSNLHLLVGVHVMHAKCLQAALIGWPFISGAFGNLMFSFSEALEIYVEYMTNSEVALDTYTFLSKSEKFSAFVSNIERHEKMTLLEAIRLPFTRIEEYDAGLHAISQLTPPSHPDSHNLFCAISCIGRLNVHLSECVVRAKGRAQVESVRRQLADVDSETFLRGKNKVFHQGELSIVAHGSRKDIMDPPSLKLKEKKQERYVFLFDDVIVISKLRDTASAKRQFRFKGTVSLRDVHVDGECGVRLCFDVHTPFESFRFQASSDHEKSVWLRHLKFLTEECRVFSVSLSKTLITEGKSENDVPDIVSKSVVYLQEKGLECEGLFRQSADGNEIEDLRALFDSGDKDIDLHGHDPYAVACVLKLWLRELPDPCIPYSMFSKFVECADNSRDLSTPQLVLASPLAAAVQALPQAHRSLLGYIALFCHNVAGRADANRMTLNNLAVVLAPNLLRTQEETLAAAMLAPRINASILLVLEHAETLFPG
eukprot:TRINITY_DN9488_c0_g1_i1.p1 TRINITY_DN9488_c0_g1~~TRINITY_DN9488_c0_g1_i1.p1  ORF type:complete len:763 (+),score=170.86 TRINITY_DN9488_c0_g1_i1:77-2365(+)